MGKPDALTIRQRNVRPISQSQWQEYFRTHNRAKIKLVFGSSMNPPSPAHKQMILEAIKELQKKYPGVAIEVTLLPVFSHVSAEKQGENIMRPYEDRLEMTRSLACELTRDFEKEGIKNVTFNVSNKEEELAKTSLDERKYAPIRFKDHDSSKNRQTPAATAVEYLSEFLQENPEDMLFYVVGDDNGQQILDGLWADTERLSQTIDGLIIAPRPPKKELGQTKRAATVESTTLSRIRNASPEVPCFKISNQKRILPEYENDLDAFAKRTDERIRDRFQQNMIWQIELPSEMDGISSSEIRRQFVETNHGETQAKRQAAEAWLKNPKNCLPRVYDYIKARPHLYSEKSHDRKPCINFGIRGAPPTLRDKTLIKSLAKQIHNKALNMDIKIVVTYDPKEEEGFFNFKRSVELTRGLVDEINKELQAEGLNIEISVCDKEKEIHTRKLSSHAELQHRSRPLGTVEYMKAEAEDAIARRLPGPVFCPGFGLPTLRKLINKDVEKSWRDPSSFLFLSHRIFVIGAEEELKQFMLSLEAELKPDNMAHEKNSQQIQILQRICDKQELFTPIAVELPDAQKYLTVEAIRTAATEILFGHNLNAINILPPCVIGKLTEWYHQIRAQQSSNTSALINHLMLAKGTDNTKDDEDNKRKRRKMNGPSDDEMTYTGIAYTGT